jgi:hypothetical protein
LRGYADGREIGSAPALTVLDGTDLGFDDSGMEGRAIP